MKRLQEQTRSWDLSQDVVRLIAISSLLLCPLSAHPATSTPQANSTVTTGARHSSYQHNQLPKRASMYYQNVWGVDSLAVQTAESGELIRFNYRILDVSKAKQLGDKKAEPMLIAPRAGVKLVVPSLEKVGQLRQSGTAEEGKVYWMAFSNKGHVVRKGDRVNVVIGRFHADNLLVE